MISRIMVLLLLGLAIAASGIAVALVANSQRIKHTEWSALHDEQKALQLDQQRLEIELSVWSQPVRIEEVARQQMGLRDSDRQHLVVLSSSKEQPVE